MSSQAAQAVRRLLFANVPKGARGFKTSGSANGGGGHIQKGSHEEIVFGDGHHGLRKGYTYDYEHGPHYLEPSKIPNFQKKWNIVMPAVFGVAIGIPIFAVWYQQFKLKASG